MASKAYVVAMTVSELKEELKQRGLSTKGGKKDLRDRLEQALYDEELDDPISESESGGEGPSFSLDFGSGGFNFEVPPESFIAEEDIVPDIEEVECEPMIVSVELSNKERLEVCPRESATTKMEVGVEGRSMGDRSLGPMVAPMIVELNMSTNRQGRPPADFSMCGDARLARSQAQERSKESLPLGTQIQSGEESAGSALVSSVSVNGSPMQREAKVPSSEGGAEVVVSLPQDQAGRAEIMHVTEDQFSSVTELLIADSVSSEGAGKKAKSGMEVVVSMSSANENSKVGTLEQRAVENVAAQINASQVIPAQVRQEGSRDGALGQPERDSVTDAKQGGAESGQPKQKSVESGQCKREIEDEIEACQLTQESKVDAESCQPGNVDAESGQPKQESDVDTESGQHKQESDVESGQPKQESSESDQPKQESTVDVESGQPKQESTVDVESGQPKQGSDIDAESGQPKQESNVDTESGQPVQESDKSGQPKLESEDSSHNQKSGVVDAEFGQPKQDYQRGIEPGERVDATVSCSGEQKQMERTFNENTQSNLNRDKSKHDVIVQSSPPASCLTPAESDDDKRSELETSQVSTPQLSLPVIEDRGESEVHSDAPLTDKSAAVVTFKSADFQSPKRSPCPVSAGNLMLYEDDRYMSNPLLLLQSPAPSLDDNSSLRVEPPSPRSETSTMDMTSFVDTSSIDGQATPHELMETLDSDATLLQEPETNMETDVHPSAKEVLGEERVESEISELSSLPPPIDEDEANEEGLPHYQPDGQKLASEAEVSSEKGLAADGRDLEVAAQIEGETLRVDECSNLPNVTNTMPVAADRGDQEEASEEDVRRISASPDDRGRGGVMEGEGEEEVMAEAERGAESPNQEIGDQGDDAKADEKFVQSPIATQHENIADLQFQVTIPPPHQQDEFQSQDAPLPCQDHVVGDLKSHDNAEDDLQCWPPQQDTTEDDLQSRDLAPAQQDSTEADVESQNIVPPPDQDIAKDNQESQNTVPTPDHQFQDTVTAPELDDQQSKDTVPAPELDDRQSQDTVPTPERDDRQSQDTVPTPELDDRQSQDTVPASEKDDQPSQDTVPAPKQEIVEDDLQEQAMQTSGGSPPKEVGGGSPVEPAEVSVAALDSGQIEVDLLVHAEAEDLSVFSSEAAEADQLRAFGHRKGGSSKLNSKAGGPSGSLGGGARRGSQSSRTSSPSGGGGSSSRRTPPPSAASRDGKRGREEKQEVHVDPPSIKRRRVSANVTSSGEGCVAGTETRKRKWGSARQRSNSGSTSTAISTDVLKDIIPAGLVDMEGVISLELDLEGIDSVDVEMAAAGEPSSGKEVQDTAEQLSVINREWEEVEREREGRRKEVERARQEIETRRRIEARLRAKQEAEGRARRESTENAKNHAPSPPRNTPCKLVHVNHLTRPFTKGQLFEILTEDGLIVQERFWTNRIKSHCIVLYQTLEAAIATRNRLHGTKWPSTNPKLLAVDFLTAEDALRLSEGELVVEEELVQSGARETKEVEVASEEAVKKEEKKEDGDKRSADTKAIVLSKENGVVSALPSSSPRQRKERPSSPSRREDQEGPPPVELETTIPMEPPPKKEATRLLDELFRKTKTTPCIYWLPLTETEIADRVAKEKAHEAERERRREERLRQRQEEVKAREKERRERHERLDAERERRAKARLCQQRTRSRSRSRSRSRDQRRKK